MNNEPLVSIIIPTYNRAFCLANAIKSVLDQTYSNIEIIVVDGPSKDDTETVINKLGDKKIIYIREEKARGAGAARNTGIKVARGEYIAFQDSDNVWFPEKLEKQMDILMSASQDVGMIYTGYKKICNDVFKGYYPQKNIKHKSGFLLNELLVENFIGCQTVVTKKECFNRVGYFDELLPTTEDWELFIRISGQYKILCINQPLVLSYIQSDSISVDLRKMVIAFKLILERHFSEFSKNKRLLAQYYFNNIATILCENNEHGEGRAFMVKAMKLNPYNIKYYLVYVISLLGNNSYRLSINVSKLFKTLKNRAIDKKYFV